MKTRKLKVELTQGMIDHLDTLVQTGLYGTCPEEAVERILQRWFWDNIQKIEGIRIVVPED